MSLQETKTHIPTYTDHVRFGPVSQHDIQAQLLSWESKDNPAAIMRDCQNIANSSGLPVRFACESAVGMSRHTFFPEPPDKPVWEDDHVQFPRFIAEAEAAGAGPARRKETNHHMSKRKPKFQETVILPPVCPFGGGDDQATLRSGGNTRVCWQIGDNLFLRVNLWGSGRGMEPVYFIGSRKLIQEDCVEWLTSQTDPIVPDEHDVAMFRDFKMNKVLKLIGYDPCRA